MSPLNRNPLGLRIDTRLAGYAALAAAALAAPGTAEAAIVYTGPISLTIPSDIDGIYLNIVTGASSAVASSVPGWDINPYSASGLNMFTSTGATGNGTAIGGVGAYVGTGGTYFNLAVGTLVGPASPFGDTGINTINAGTPLNFNSSNNIIGFRFFNEAAGQIQYGWMRISLSTSASSQPRLIVEYAYENTGVGIFAPLVPEPSSAALFGVMAAGALGVRAWRRRKVA